MKIVYARTTFRTTKLPSARRVRTFYKNEKDTKNFKKDLADQKDAEEELSSMDISYDSLDEISYKPLEKRASSSPTPALKKKPTRPTPAAAAASVPLKKDNTKQDKFKARAAAAAAAAVAEEKPPVAQGPSVPIDLPEYEKTAARVKETMASLELPTFDEKSFSELGQKATTAWKNVENKPVALSLALVALIGLYGMDGLLDNLESLPLIPAILKLEGFGVTAWYTYRYATSQSARDKFKAKWDELYAKIVGLNPPLSSSPNYEVDDMSTERMPGRH
jgi:hypothetical protein